jgi:Ca-activated chloride channel homolog
MSCTARVLLASTLALAPTLTQDPAPMLQVLFPAEGAYVSGPVTIQVRLVPLAAEARISRISFFADGTSVCTVERRPFTCIWNAGRTVRAHQLRVVADMVNGERLVRTVRTLGIDHTESSGVSAVQVPTTVVDGRGRFVNNLTAADFTVLEANVRQTITGFSAEQTDVALAIALDTSGSMERTLDTVKLQAKEFLGALPATWPTTVLSFDQSVFTVAGTGVSPDERNHAIDKLKAWGGTALYTAVLNTLERVSVHVGRKAIVVFTDGDDRNSMVDATEVRRAIEQSDAVIYFVTAGDAAKSGSTRELLSELAETSGGRLLQGHDNESLREAFAQVRDEIRNQYLLTYVPVRFEKSGTWRPLSVKASCRGCRVRARTGYRVAPN